MSRFVVRGRSASVAVTVQVVDKRGSRVVSRTHVGSTHTDTDLAILLERADRLVHPGQEAFEPGELARFASMEAVADWTRPLDREQVVGRGRPTSSARSSGVVVGQPARILWQALTEAYGRVGFTALGDETFMKVVLDRIVEPTSKVDTIRVLEERTGVEAPSISTIYRMLERVNKGKYREQLAQACFSHDSRGGPLTLVMHDCTTLICRRSGRAIKPRPAPSLNHRHNHNVGTTPAGVRKDAQATHDLAFLRYDDPHVPFE